MCYVAGSGQAFDYFVPVVLLPYSLSLVPGTPSDVLLYFNSPYTEHSATFLCSYIEMYAAHGYSM